MQSLADLIGIGMHSVQKTVKGTRTAPHVQEQIADVLGMEVDHCFGPRADIHLRRLISREIGREVWEHRQQLEKRVLGKINVPAHFAVVNV